MARTDRTTKIAIVGDSHFDQHSRLEECKRLHGWIASDARERGVELVLHAGDVFEKKSTPDERNAFAAWVTACADFAPVVIVRGNHDALDDLLIFGGLEATHPVIVEQAAAVHVVQAGEASVAVACLAWPRRAQLLASGTFADHADPAGAALRAVLAGMRDRVEAHAGPTILVSHAMVRGSVTSVGQPLIGAEMEIGHEDLALAGAGFVALGHIHMPQDWEHGGVPIVYTGSPRRTSFGEIEEKSYLLVTFDGPELVGWERIPVPATPMVLLDVTVAADGTVSPVDLSGLEGAEVRLRVHGPASARTAIRDASTELLAALEQGGALPKIEEVISAETRARAPEVAKATSLQDKLLAHWASKGQEHPLQAEALLLVPQLEGAS